VTLDAKQTLAQGLRRHPTWAEAYLEAREVLHDVEGCILAFWTDIPESELERLRLRIRALDEASA
jgi:hypothetical protein